MWKLGKVNISFHTNEFLNWLIFIYFLKEQIQLLIFIVKNHWVLRKKGKKLLNFEEWITTNLWVGILVEDPKHGHLCCNGFTRACWGPQQDVGVGVIECVKDLSLDGVEVSKFVQALKLTVTQSCHWQWLQVQQLYKHVESLEKQNKTKYKL